MIYHKKSCIILDKLTISRKHANQQFMVRATFDVEDLIGTDLTYFNYYSPEPNHWHEKFVKNIDNRKKEIYTELPDEILNLN